MKTPDAEQYLFLRQKFLNRGGNLLTVRSTIHAALSSAKDGAVSALGGTMAEFTSPGFVALLIAGLLATGAIAGILAGLLGVGGGIVIVPVLFLLFNALAIPDSVSMHVAVATSLATIIPTSISSARAHHRRGAVDPVLLKLWAPFIIAGAGFGGFISQYIKGDYLTAIFGGIALLVALNMANPRKFVVADKLPANPLTNGMIGGIIGTLSALMGIGGGTFSVPALTLYSVPVHRAVGTAAAFGFVIAVPATLGFIYAGWGVEGRPPYSLGYVSIPAALIIFSATILTAPQGARLAHAINPQALRLAFAVFLAITSIRMLMKAFL